ncbi:MAG: tripartite tricarboxylate transporter substrate binding protein [Kiloniellaceae bacterium]
MTFERLKSVAAGLALALAAFAAAPAGPALADYPEKPVTLLIPFSAGGGNDTVARALATRLEAPLGQPIVAANRTGAGGYVAAQQMRDARADGYTLAQQSLGTFILTSLFKPQAVDPLKDVEYVAQIALLSSGLAVPADSPYQTLDDFIAALKANPGTMTWGHTGRGGFHYVNGVSFFKSTGLEARDVPFKGSSKTRAALLGNQIDAAFIGLNVYPGFEDKIRFLAIASDERDSLQPQFPTFKEQGVDMITVDTPTVITVKAGTDPAIIEKLEAAIESVVTSEDYTEALKASGVPARFASSEEVRAKLEGRIDDWKSIIDYIKARQ